MSGSEQGLQTLAQKACPMTLYIWSHLHGLSLVVEKTVEFCGIVKQFFGLLEEIHTFMFWNKARKKCLKRISSTQWGGNHAACTTLLSCYSETKGCLEKINKDKDSTKEINFFLKVRTSKIWNTRAVWKVMHKTP